MTEELEAILRRVASGELTPEEAESLVTAASTRAPSPRDDQGDVPGSTRPADAGTASTGRSSSGSGRGASEGAPGPGSPGGPRRTVRLQVLENGRAVVNLRIPMSWAGIAGNVLPGLSGFQAERLREAIRSGEVGTIFEVRDEDGDGVVISTE